MTRHPWKQLITTIPVCLLAASVSFAQQGERNRQRSGTNDPQGDRSTQQVELPQFLDKLDLTSEQQQSIRQALRQNNRKLRETWREFDEKHARAIELEAAWAAAVRDTLSEQDQRKFDQQRMQDREMSRHSQDHATQRSDAASSQRDQTRQRRQSNPPPADNTRRQNRQQRQRDNAQRQQSQTDAESGADNPSQQHADAGDEYGFVVFTITSPEFYTQGTNQSDEQKQQCSEACRQYMQELTSVWHDVRRLHGELVQIEADRIQAIEKELTEDQLAELKDQRQAPPAETASHDSSTNRSR